MAGDSGEHPSTWQSTYEPLTDGQWALIVDLVQAYSVTGKMGRPPKWDRRDIVNAIFYVAATGCQWRALPAEFPHWNTVHRYHVTWSRDGTDVERLVKALVDVMSRVFSGAPNRRFGAWLHG